MKNAVVFLFSLLSLLPMSHAETQGGIGLLLIHMFSGNGRPDNPIDYSSICKQFEDETIYMVSLYPAYNNSIIYKRKSADSKDCKPVINLKEFYAANPEIKEYIKNAMAKAGELQVPETAESKLLFNTHVEDYFYKQSWRGQFNSWFVTPANAEGVNWQIDLKVEDTSYTPAQQIWRESLLK